MSHERDHSRVKSPRMLLSPDWSHQLFLETLTGAINDLPAVREEDRVRSERPDDHPFQYVQDTVTPYRKGPKGLEHRQTMGHRNVPY